MSVLVAHIAGAKLRPINAPWHSMHWWFIKRILVMYPLNYRYQQGTYRVQRFCRWFQFPIYCWFIISRLFILWIAFISNTPTQVTKVLSLIPISHVLVVHNIKKVQAIPQNCLYHSAPTKCKSATSCSWSQFPMYWWFIMKVPAMYPLNCQYPLANLPGAEVRRVVVDPDFPCIGGLSSKWPLKVNCCDNRINLIIPLRRLFSLISPLLRILLILNVC